MSLIAQLVKNPPAMQDDPGSVPGEGKGYPLQYSGLESSMDHIDHRVTKSQTQLSDFHCHCISNSAITSIWYFLSLLKFSLYSFILSRPLSIFMTVTFNSSSARLLIFISLSSFWWEFALFFALKLIPMFPHFACLCVFVNM